jgi:hypothetical protein
MVAYGPAINLHGMSHENEQFPNVVVKYFWGRLGKARVMSGYLPSIFT